MSSQLDNVDVGTSQGQPTQKMVWDMCSFRTDSDGRRCDVSCRACEQKVPSKHGAATPRVADVCKHVLACSSCDARAKDVARMRYEMARAGKRKTRLRAAPLGAADRALAVTLAAAPAASAGQRRSMVIPHPRPALQQRKLRTPSQEPSDTSVVGDAAEDGESAIWTESMDHLMLLSALKRAFEAAGKGLPPTAAARSSVYYDHSNTLGPMTVSQAFELCVQSARGCLRGHASVDVQGCTCCSVYIATACRRRSNEHRRHRGVAQNASASQRYVVARARCGCKVWLPVPRRDTKPRLGTPGEQGPKRMHPAVVRRLHGWLIDAGTIAHGWQRRAWHGTRRGAGGTASSPRG